MIPYQESYISYCRMNVEERIEPTDDLKPEEAGFGEVALSKEPPAPVGGAPLKNIEKIPSKVVPRLSRYYRVLYEYDQTMISSQSLSALTGFTAAQIRKDLGYFGQFGSPGKGYVVEDLKKSIKKILGLDRIWNVMLIGVGNLGLALLGYRGFKQQGFDIVAAFDSDSSKIGRVVNGVTIYPMDKMSSIIKNKNIQIAIITVPGPVAQQTAEEACKAGITSILNFAPAHLRLPDTVKVRHIDMTIEIERLSFLISRG